MSAFKTAALMTITSCLIWGQVVHLRSEGLLRLPGSSWRFWDDMALAIGRYVDSKSPKKNETTGGTLESIVEPYRGLVEDKVTNYRIPPHEFWRTVPDRQFFNQVRPFSAPEYEDPGRSLLLYAGFRILGGVAPYLLLWLGVFAFFVPLLWILHELISTGQATAAAVLGGLFSFSPFWSDCLSLPHSAMGFYLGGLVALGALSIGLLMRKAAALCPWSSVAPRVLAFAAIIIVALWCRSGALVFVPAGLIVAATAFRRAGQAWPRAIALSLTLILLPALLFRPANRHNVWLPLWEGLGDFGRDRGYSWYDADAGRFLAKQGFPLRLQLRYLTTEEEGVFQRAFLAEVTSSPWWYSRILLQRVAATVFLAHLDPYGPRDGESKRTPLFHYKYAIPVDWFGFGETIVETPISVLYAPTLLLVILALASSKTRPPRELEVLGSVALGALPIPVLISTASGLETQGFSLVHFLAIAFLAQRVADMLTVRWTRA